MKYLITLIFIAGCFCVNAQDSDSSIVVNQGDPSIEKLPVEGNRELIEYSPERIPSAIKKTLDGKKYKGWANSTLYYDKTMQLYWLEICKENKPVRYYFDKNGKPATGKM